MLRLRNDSEEISGTLRAPSKAFPCFVSILLLMAQMFAYLNDDFARNELCRENENKSQVWR